MKIGNPGVIGFYMTFMQTLHQTLGWCYPVWAVTHAGHCVPPDTMDVIDGIYRNYQDVFGILPNFDFPLDGLHKLVFLSEHIPRDTCLVLMGHSVGCYIILEMLTLVQVVKSVMLFPTIERMAVTPRGRLLTPVLCHLRLCNLPARLPSLCCLKYSLLSTYLYTSHCSLIPACLFLLLVFLLGLLLWMFCHSYVQLVFYYGACDHWYHVQYHQETKRDFPNGDIRLCRKEVADMIVEWIHGNLQTWS
uniref:Lipid droplet-associated hydrolase n=1 Tax=Oncorhynchus mykiss TaxID=8022 RepID=A0A8C7UCW0_ONCMY